MIRFRLTDFEVGDPEPDQTSPGLLLLFLLLLPILFSVTISKMSEQQVDRKDMSGPAGSW